MLRSLLAMGLCLLLLVPPAYGAPPEDQPAGEVKALIPDASRNSQPLSVKDTLRWNDLLQTNAKGRMRASLNDGSILSLGSNSELRVVQHDAASQQTSIDLNYGKLRSQVVKITQPGGKYEVKTPNAVIGVIGTDFYVAYENGRTTVVCYEGALSATPGDGSSIVESNNASTGTTTAVTVSAGQMIVIGPKPEGGSAPPYDAFVKKTKKSTAIEAAHRGRAATFLSAAVIAGLTIALTQINSSSKSCGCK